MNVDQVEEDLRAAWAASGFRVAGQEGGGGSPAPHTSTQAANELGTGAMLFLGLMFLAVLRAEKLFK